MMAFADSTMFSWKGSPFSQLCVIVIIRGGVDHLLADGPVRAADGDILHRTAEAAHGVPLEMGQHHHRVVIKHVFADRHFLETLPAFNGDHHRAVLVHDVHRAEIPAVDLEGFAMIRRCVSLALVQGIGFHQSAVGNMLLQGFHHVPRQDVGAVRLAGMHLDGCLSGNTPIDPGIDLQQPVDTDIFRKKHLGFVLLRGESAAHPFQIE